jgi:DNA-binding NtrC family response regulator
MSEAVGGMASARVLVLEDDAALSEIICDELRARGHSTVPAASVSEGIEQLSGLEFDVALLDLMLPDGSGIDLLRRIREEDLATEAVVLTGYAAIGTAIEAMKMGAYDYLTKPVRMDELELIVSKAAEKASLRRENLSMRVRLQRLHGAQGVITEDPGMKALLAQLDRVAGSDLPVLVVGETGTGKELIARALHQRSDRAAQAFVAVSCAAMPETLLESELFGYEKGAFTGAQLRKPGMFELADRGVLFLDEIGDVPASVQVKLLRAVETREFYRVGGTRPVRADLRIVSATNRDLKKAIEAGTFREDLYFRLNGVTLNLPPLRERKGDVALLATHFLDRVRGDKRTLTRKAIEKLDAYPWPGNVRELEMVIRRAAVLSSARTLDADDLPLEVRQADWKSTPSTGRTLADVEREYIDRVLAENNGHRGRSAKALGIDVKTLYNKLGPEHPRAK